MRIMTKVSTVSAAAMAAIIASPAMAYDPCGTGATSVPEPGMLALFGLGVGAVVLARFRNKR